MDYLYRQQVESQKSVMGQMEPLKRVGWAETHMSKFPFVKFYPLDAPSYHGALCPWEDGAPLNPVAGVKLAISH